MIFTIITIFMAINAFGEIPRLINLQGYLADEDGPVTGVFEATFRIYDSAEGGNILWSETDSVAVDVGLYSQVLGEATSIDIEFNGNLWIAVQFTGHPEMIPRYRQTSVPFSFVTQFADSSSTVSDNSITGEKIVDGTVQESDLAFETVSRPLSPGVSASEIADGAVTSDKILDGTIQQQDLSFTPVSRPLTPGITTNEIADNAITSNKILDGTILETDLSFTPVSRPLTPGIENSELADNAVTTEKILDGTVQESDLSFTPISRPLTPGIASNEIAIDAITSDKILDGTIGEIDLSFTPVSRPISPGIATDEIANNAITTGKILDNSVTSPKILDNSIQTNDLAFTPAIRPLNPGVTTNEIANNAVTSVKILDGTIGLNDIGQNGAVSGQIMKWNGSAWTVANDETGGGGSGGGWTDDGNYIRLETEADSVGIGTATPTEKLDVVGSARIVGKTLIGNNQTNTGQMSSISGGANNSINNFAYAATIGGGINNTVSYNYAVVSGGANNTASQNTSTVSGGNGNTASGHSSSIGGGVANTASETDSRVGGGSSNTASGHSSYIGGGLNNTVNGIASAVGGGYHNIIDGVQAFIGGGGDNTAAGQYAVVGGGSWNHADDSSATVAGGRYNNVTGPFSTVGGGGGLFSSDGNIIPGRFSTITGGRRNYINADYSSIPGGYNNRIEYGANYSYLFGINAELYQDSTFMVDMPRIRFGGEFTGYLFPTLDGAAGQVMATDGSGQLSWVDMGGGGGTGSGWVDDGTIVRLETNSDNVGIGTANPTAKLDVLGDLKARKGNLGFQNTNTGDDAFVAGNGNAASGLNSSIAGGFQNTVNSTRSFIGGGGQNLVNGQYSAILGGAYNRVLADYASIGVGYFDTVQAIYGGVSSGTRNSAGNEAADTAAFVGGGSYNSVSARYGAITGGTGNIVSGRYGTVAGGQANSVEGDYGTIGGGSENIVGSQGVGTVAGGAANQALGSGSMIPGGIDNATYGITSFAAGAHAKAMYDGSFVWSDFGPNDYSSTDENQVLFRARGGFYIADAYNVNTIELNPTTRRITINNSSGTPVVELGEGLDYAEIFSTSTENLEPGTVMIIDPENPGQLTISRDAYDKKVSGIIAGANGLGTGVKLGRKTEAGDESIALAGRVYCNVDASYGAIEPGDLLTTSPTPGHAMVVKDHSKAVGSILGKAMEPLATGEKGKILVLVTLQ